MRVTPLAAGGAAPAEVTLSRGPHLLASRLRPPQPLLELVRRERLLRQLSGGAAPLIVVAAPAGSGKTMALSQWAESDPRPVAWLQADESDNDPLVLLTYLLAALDPIVVIDPMVERWLQQAPPPVATRIVPALAAALGATAPFVLIVDDAHLVTNEASWQLVGVLLDQVPPGVQLCLSGRASPPLPLARMRAAGRLLEIGAPELALTSQEIYGLLRLQGVVADAEAVAYLKHVTEGWAAGVYLAALARAQAPQEEWLAGIRGHQHHVARYLASEVLAQQPPEIARFVLQTCILERLCPSLCRAVTGDEEAGELLRSVARLSLFISALDDVDEWFRYHHLFAEFLQAELLRRDEAEAALLHARAAAWFEEHDQLEEAVRHWLAAGEAGCAGQVVCRAHMDYTHLARYETTRRWLEMFTDEQILDDEALTLTAGWIAAMTGDSPRGRAWISAAMRLRIGDGMWPGAPVPLRAMQAGLAAALAEGVTQLRENAEIAVALSEGAHPTERAPVTFYLGFARWLSGDDTEVALRILREAEELGATANALAQMAAVACQALIAADEDRWAEARRLTVRALRRLEEAGLTWGPPTYPTLLAQTRLQAHDGDPGVVDSIAAIREISAPGSMPPCLALLGDVLAGESLVQLGDPAEATRWMHAGFARLATMQDAGIMRLRLLRLRDRIEQRRLLEPLTPAERRVLELLPTELSLKEIGSRLSVSRETARTHARDIYRKLEVHSRSEAVAKARELELMALLPRRQLHRDEDADGQVPRNR